jgi:hypothetical protein
VTIVVGDPVRDIRDRGQALRFGFVTPQMWRTWDELVAISRHSLRHSRE